MGTRDDYKLVADYNLWIMQAGNEGKDIWAVHDHEGHFLFDVLEEDYEEMLDLDLVDCGYMTAPHTEAELLDYQRRWGILWTEKVTAGVFRQTEHGRLQGGGLR